MVVVALGANDGLRGQSLRQRLFSFIVLVAELVETRQAHPGLGVRGVDTGERFEMDDGLAQAVFGDFVLLSFAQIVPVKSGEQPVSVFVVRLDFQNGFGLADCISYAPHSPVEFGQLDAKEERVGISLERLLVFGYRPVGEVAPIPEPRQFSKPAGEHEVVIRAGGVRSRGGFLLGCIHRRRLSGFLRGHDPGRADEEEAYSCQDSFAGCLHPSFFGKTSLKDYGIGLQGCQSWRARLRGPFRLPAPRSQLPWCRSDLTCRNA